MICRHWRPISQPVATLPPLKRRLMFTFIQQINFALSLLKCSQIEKEAKAVATFMEAAYFNNSGAVQGVVVLTQEVKKKKNYIYTIP